VAVELTKLATFENPKVKLEQYQTEAEIAAQVIWKAFLNGDIEGKSCIDLGCGTGILGIGALILGARKVTFVDIDLEALIVLSIKILSVFIGVLLGGELFHEKNLKRKYRAEFVQREIRLYKKRAQVIIQNPPFGTKQPHADKAFLLKAMELAPTIYSIHKIAGERFIATLAEDNGFSIKGIIPIKFPLKPTLTFHRKKTYYTDVGVWMLEKRRRKV